MHVKIPSTELFSFVLLSFISIGSYFVCFWLFRKICRIETKLTIINVENIWNVTKKSWKWKIFLCSCKQKKRCILWATEIVVCIVNPASAQGVCAPPWSQGGEKGVEEVTETKRKGLQLPFVGAMTCKKKKKKIERKSNNIVLYRKHIFKYLG